MLVSEDGHVSGSIDRVRVAELLAATDDDELKAHYREALGESGDAEAAAEPAEAEPEAEEVGLDELRAEAEAAGVKVDGRWGADRLREEIAAAQGEGEEE